MLPKIESSLRRSRAGPRRPTSRTPGPARDPARGCSRAKASGPRSSSREGRAPWIPESSWSGGKYHTPNYARAPICLVRGDGVACGTPTQGYLDFGAGLAVAALGHCHPRVTGAIREAAATLLHVSNLYYTAPQIHLAKLLCDHSFASGLPFALGGRGERGRAKLARKYAKERYASDRYEVHRPRTTPSTAGPSPP